MFGKEHDAKSIQEELVDVSILVLGRGLVCCDCGIDRDGPPPMHSCASNQGCHGVLRRQKLELDTVFPAQALFEELPQVFDAGALPGSRNAEQAIAHWLRQLFLLLLIGRSQFCTLLLASLNYSLQKPVLLGCGRLLALSKRLQPLVDLLLLPGQIRARLLSLACRSFIICVSLVGIAWQYVLEIVG